MLFRSVVFADGETSQIVTVSVSGDTAFEADEEFTVTISNPDHGEAITTSTAIGTIENDEPSLAITATDAVKAEEDSGNTSFTFTITRSGDTTGTTSVDYTVAGSGGDQADSADFGGAQPSGTVNFAEGETSKVVTINVSGDTDIEGNEGFTVTISNPGNSEPITASTASGTIENDDTDLSIAANSAVKAEGDSGNMPFTFTVTREGDATGETSVDYAVTGSGVDPADGDDFGGSLPSGTVNFSDGETSVTITVNATGDQTVEQDEGFTITLSNPGHNETITTSTASGTIENDDTSLSIAANSAVKTEGDSGTSAFTFTVTREGDTTGETSVDYAVTGSGDDPADAADFGGTLPSGTVEFGNGETEKIITVNVSGDTDFEPDETFTVSLSNPTKDRKSVV